MNFATAKKVMVHRFEYRYVTRLLRLNKGNVSASAKQAGMDRCNFIRLMHKNFVDPRQFRPDTRVKFLLEAWNKRNYVPKYNNLGV